MNENGIPMEQRAYGVVAHPDKRANLHRENADTLRMMLIDTVRFISHGEQITIAITEGLTKR